jgi:hypothetical protein
MTEHVVFSSSLNVNRTFSPAPLTELPVRNNFLSRVAFPPPIAFGTIGSIGMIFEFPFQDFLGSLKGSWLSDYHQSYFK